MALLHIQFVPDRLLPWSVEMASAPKYELDSEASARKLHNYECVLSRFVFHRIPTDPEYESGNDAQQHRWQHGHVLRYKCFCGANRPNFRDESVVDNRSRHILLQKLLDLHFEKAASISGR